MIRDFLWRDSPQKRASHHVNWITICQPLNEGGLGIKRIADWNKAATGVHLWDVATGMESLWVKWIHSRYLKSHSLWEVKVRSTSTTIWRKILAARDWIKPKVKYNIYSGSNINICGDPWIDGDGLAGHFGERLALLFGLNKDSKVSWLIVNGKWHKPR
ncbi:hypothetical protein QJS04_geneDACA001958 [Acorus gramineus]|uniref:Uncharacterized protein n=1 Tax=Acorus gramineus TaxID=55184 RepID=A0AAV9A7K8_ACOGR|nr:hypothetical protein QJS04_geneDACA001958 [Acorus gramineus]